MSKTTTAVIELENVDLNEAASDFTDIGRLVTDITAIVTEFSDGLPSSIQRADSYIVRISALLERSVSTTYRTPVGLLYGSAADRYALMAQSIVKSAGRDEAEIQRLISEGERLLAILAAIELESATTTLAQRIRKKLFR